MEETQSRWLAFERGETDIEYQLWEVAPTFMTEDGRLKPEFAKRGIRLDRSVDPEITYTHFNMQETIGGQPNPLGGFGREKHRAAPRDRDGVQDRRSDQHHPQGPGDQGGISDPARRRRPRSGLPQPAFRYDPRTANALLDKFGYQEGRGRLSHAAGRQAARDPLLVVADRARPPVRRAREALARCDRRSRRNPQGTISRADQARQAMPADDAQLAPGSPTTRTATTSCSSCTARTPGRATARATVRAEFDRLYEQSRKLAGRRRAQPALSRHDAPDGGAHGMDPGRQPLSQRAFCSRM